MDLLLRGDLEELNRPCSPSLAGFNPAAWPPFIAGLKVLVVGELPRALDQSETAGVLIKKVAGLQASGIAEWAPKLLAPPVDDGKAVGIVDGRKEIIDAGAVNAGEEKHAGKGRDASIGEVLARIERGLDIDRRGRARGNFEPVCTRH